MSGESIELVVEEPMAGTYYWVLRRHDASGANAVEIERAPGPIAHYGAAMMAGIAALQRRADARAPGASPPEVTAWVDRDTDFGPPTVL